MDRTQKGRRDHDRPQPTRAPGHVPETTPETGAQQRNVQAGQVEGLEHDPWANWAAPQPANLQASQVEGLAALPAGDRDSSPEERVGGQSGMTLPAEFDHTRPDGSVSSPQQSLDEVPWEAVTGNYVSPGDRGYTGELLEQTHEEATVEFVLETMEPNFEPLEAAIATRRAETKKYNTMASDSNIHAADYTAAADAAASHVEMLIRQKQEIQDVFNEYKMLVPTGNLFMRSVARLHAMASLMGVEAPTNAEGYLNMAQAMSAELYNAETVMLEMQQDGSDPDLPAIDQSLLLAAEALQYKRVQLDIAYNDWDAMGIKLEQGALMFEKELSEAELEKIEEIRAHMGACGGLIDTVWAGVGTKGVTAAGAKKSGVGLAKKAGKATGIPTSGQEVFEGIVDWAYHDELNELRTEIKTIEGFMRTQDQIQEILNTRAIHQRFSLALEGYADAMDAYQLREDQRMQDYRQLGASMDTYANGDRDQRKAGRAAQSRDGERYELLFAVLGQAREAALNADMMREVLGKSGSLTAPDGLATLRGTRAHVPDSPHRLERLQISGLELSALKQIMSHASGLQGRSDIVTAGLGGLDALAGRVFTNRDISGVRPGNTKAGAY